MKFTLKALRINKNLTQKQLSEKLGICRNTIIAWERGERFPDAMQIKKLEELYDVQFADIIFLPKNNALN